MTESKDEVLWQYGPDSPKLLVLETLERVSGRDRFGISEKYEWKTASELADTQKNRKFLEEKAVYWVDSGIYSRIVLRDDPEALEKEQFIESSR